MCVRFVFLLPCDIPRSSVYQVYHAERGERLVDACGRTRCADPRQSFNFESGACSCSLSEMVFVICPHEIWSCVCAYALVRESVAFLTLNDNARCDEPHVCFSLFIFFLLHVLYCDVLQFSKIPYNETSVEVQFEATHWRPLLEFQAAMRSNGILTTIRQEMGGAVDGACGQLALKNRSDREEAGDPNELF